MMHKNLSKMKKMMDEMLGMIDEMTGEKEYKKKSMENEEMGIMGGKNRKINKE